MVIIGGKSVIENVCGIPSILKYPWLLTGSWDYVD
jgi:hypothetical protein